MSTRPTKAKSEATHETRGEDPRLDEYNCSESSATSAPGSACCLAAAEGASGTAWKRREARAGRGHRARRGAQGERCRGSGSGLEDARRSVTGPLCVERRFRAISANWRFWLLGGKTAISRNCDIEPLPNVVILSGVILVNSPPRIYSQATGVKSLQFLFCFVF